MVNLVYTKNDASGVAGVISFAGDTPHIEFDTTGVICVCDLVGEVNGIQERKSLIPGFDTEAANKTAAVEAVKLIVSIYDIDNDEYDDDDYEEDYEDLQWKMYLDDLVFKVRDIEEVKRQDGIDYVFDEFNDAVFVKVCDFLTIDITEDMSANEKMEKIDVNFRNYVDGVTKLSK